MARLAARCASLRGENTPAVAVFPEHVGTFRALAPLGRLAGLSPSTDAGTALALLARPACSPASDVVHPRVEPDPCA